MATTVSYAASLCTRKYTSSANAKSSAACQEFYDSSYNYVGIISFSGMNLANKVITSIWLDIDAAKAGYGASSTKTVYLRKANYQNGIASGIAGWQYTGDELGTFDGSFYGNYTSYYITGSLFTAMANYIAAGNNSFTIYNPYASASSHGYSFNYLQWESVVITVTYEEAVSQPTVSSSSVNLGSAVTIYTNRQSSATTHTISYWFGNTSGAIATNVGASVSWTPPLSLASQIPNATSGICTITCNSFVNGTLTGTRTCTLTLNVPSSVVPSISSVTIEDTNSTVASRIEAYVKSLSTLSVEITAAGIYGSTISSYRTSLDGVTYTAASFTASKKLSAARGNDHDGHRDRQPGPDGHLHHDLYCAGLRDSIHPAVFRRAVQFGRNCGAAGRYESTVFLLTKSIQRFARNTVDLLNTIRHLKELGIEVRFEKENINSLSGDGELMLTILASLAQEESRSISENCKWGIRKRFQSGEIGAANKHILGYRYDDALRQYVIIPEETVIVHRMFQLYLDGQSLQAICDDLNSAGYRTVNGCLFQESSLSLLIKNEIYAGDLRRQKSYMEDSITKNKVKNKGELPQYYMQDCHEGILDRETYARVQAEIARRASLLNPTYPFTKKIICGCCGNHFTRKKSKVR